MSASTTPASTKPGSSRAAPSGELRRARVRITAVATAVLLVILGIAGLAVLELFHRESVQRLDAQLDTAARYAVNLTEAGALPAAATAELGADSLVQYLDRQGVVRFAGDQLGGEPALWSPGDPVREARTVDTERNGELRVFTIPFNNGWLVMGQSLDSVDSQMHSLRQALAISAVPLAVALAALMWLVVGRTLRPVAAGMEREERLVADVGHELRSPLTGVRVLLETEPDDPAERARNTAAALATLRRIELIADRLLMQAQDSFDESARPVDLDEIVTRQIQIFSPRTTVRIDGSGVDPGQVLGREDELESLVENLLSNAARHATSLVRLTLSESGDVVELTVSDDGGGIDPEDRDRVFDRFTRLDDARSRDRGGSGLGLAIVRSIVDTHGGQISLGDTPGGGTTLVVRLPAVDPEPGARRADEASARPRRRGLRNPATTT